MAVKNSAMTPVASIASRHNQRLTNVAGVDR
jgi:hypothetical protein